MLKRLFRISLALCLTLVLLLSACAPATEELPVSEVEAPAVEEEETEEEAAPPAEPQQLVVTGWGGTWGDCMTENVIIPFEEAFNAELTLALPGGSTDILARLRAEAGSPTMDVVLIGGALENVAAEEGLMEEVDWASAAPNWNDIIAEAQAVPGYGPSIAMSAIGIGYNTETSPFVPTSWLDFWDERVAEEGRVALHNMDGNYGLALTAVLNDILGGTQDDVTPAFDKYKEIMQTHKPLITTSTQDIVDAMVQRDAWMAIGPNSRFISMAKEGLPIAVVYPKEGGFIWGNFAGIPLGSPNKDLAVDFINFYLDPEVQANWAMCVGYSPTNTKADLGDYEYADALVADTVFPLDWDWINLNRSAWIERWNSEVLPELE